jgi:hypothetical protein
MLQNPLIYTEEQLYTIWRNSNAHPPLTPKQLKIAMDYAYRNDLLTPTEEEQYERSYGIH